MPACTVRTGAGAGTGIGVMPSRSNSASSAATSGFPVVSSFSPWKIEFAPATKHSACSSSLISARPALRRTIDAGIMIRATAIVRTNSNGSSSAVPASGVPSTCTRRLIGTESGCAGRFASACSRPARCARDSPMPTMPPQQVFMPASRTWPRVSSRSWYSRVWITSP